MIRDILRNIKPETLSEICRDVGQVFFAGVLVEPIITHTSNSTMWIAGLTFSIASWSMSIYFNNKQKI